MCGFTPQKINDVLAAVDWSTWIYATGGAPVPLNFDTVEADQATALALGYIALNGAGSPENNTAYFGYYSNLKVVFHNTLEANPDLVNLAILERIDADYNCTGDIDPEVRQRWYPIGLDKNYQPVYEPAHEWISGMGRVKYLKPVYISLVMSDQCPLAEQWFNENKSFYHPVAVTSLQTVLDGCASEEETAIELYVDIEEIFSEMATKFAETMNSFEHSAIGFLN